MPLSFSILRHQDRNDDPITQEQLEDLAHRRPDLGQFKNDGFNIVFQACLREGIKNKRRILLLHDRRLFLDGGGQEELIAWLLAVAEELNARVRDNGVHTYRSLKEKYVHEEDVDAHEQHKQAVARAKAEETSFWRRHPRLNRHFCTISFFAFLSAAMILVAYF